MEVEDAIDVGEEEAQAAVEAEAVEAVEAVESLVDAPVVAEAEALPEEVEDDEAGERCEKQAVEEAMEEEEAASAQAEAAAVEEAAAMEVEEVEMAEAAGETDKASASAAVEEELAGVLLSDQRVEDAGRGGEEATAEGAAEAEQAEQAEAEQAEAEQAEAVAEQAEAMAVEAQSDRVSAGRGAQEEAAVSPSPPDEHPSSGPSSEPPPPGSSSGSSGSGGGGGSSGGGVHKRCKQCSLKASCILPRHHLGECRRRVLYLIGASAAQAEEARAAAEALDAELMLSTSGTNEARYDQRCTHLVVYQLKRTVQTLVGLAAGKWLVQPSWVSESSDTGRWLSEVPFEVHGEGCASFGKAGGSLWMGAPRAHRLRREEQGDGKAALFAGCTFVLSPQLQSAQPNREQLIRIIKAGGGRVSKDDAENIPPQGSDEELLLLLPANSQPEGHPLTRQAIERGLPCVPPEYILEMVTCEAPRGYHALRMFTSRSLS